MFTTHTPVPAGHDQFPLEMARNVLGEERATALERSGSCLDGALNMTHLALYASRYINGVAMIHGEVSRTMFPNYPVRAITNGVHAVTWTTAGFQELYDRHIPEWREDNLYLRYAVGIPIEEIRQVHRQAKKALVDEISKRTVRAFDENVMMIGFARRAATYKRGDLIFCDYDQLKWIARTVGGLQIVFGRQSASTRRGAASNSSAESWSMPALCRTQSKSYTWRTSIGDGRPFYIAGWTSG